MKKIVLLISFSIGLWSMLNAQWVSPGNGTTYTMSDLAATTEVVSFESGNYRIHADLTISTNDILKIDDGFQKIFVENALITIQGSMVCDNANRVSIMGDPSFSMRFENATDCEVKKMYFSDGAGIKIIESEVSFIDTKFLYFTRDYANAVIDFMNCNPLVEDCYFLLNKGAAISSPANGHGSPRILNNHIEENVTEDLNSPQINLGPGAEDTIYIVGNEIDGAFGTHRVGGISVADLMGTGSTKVLLKDNHVTKGRYGYNQQGLTISSVIEGNQFIDNYYEDNPMNGGSGISIYGVDENNKAVLRNNVITGNLWGITVINAADINLGTEDDWGHNEIHNNYNSGHMYDLYNNSSFDIMAIGNDWGTTSEQEVEDHIFHQNDNPDLGLVTFIPFVGYDAVEESHTALFEVSPNPAQGHFMVEGKGKVTITNTLGQVVFAKEIEGKESIVLPRGLYIVRLGDATRKVIVE
ncbi:MAG: DUF1565 domain-containing protein [Bacteroidales bacterium]|nr:DUF1565 domain-containing protein [Bacteroidales bacterium]